MNTDAFRKLALALPGALESAHMNHPDFRVAGKIFASLGYPDDDWGMVKLTPEQQSSFIQAAPDVFRPCNGVWGKRGATNVLLNGADKDLLKSALRSAFDNLAAPAKTNPTARRKQKKPRSSTKSP